mmetsp:Transcript_8285/g.18943  ORF Transcript_8285/g.18943 Transcript_8285/m.18943 type:complete len:83 (-) Transcript_8285:266-514(-)
MPGHAPLRLIPIPRSTPPRTGPDDQDLVKLVGLQSVLTWSNALAFMLLSAEKINAPMPIAPKKTLSMTNLWNRNCPLMICGS